MTHRTDAWTTGKRKSLPGTGFFGGQLGVLFLLFEEGDVGGLLGAVHPELVLHLLDGDALAVAHADGVVEAEDDVDGVALDAVWVGGGVPSLMPSLQMPQRIL